ncbi:hypothetical protein BDP81DRAFT_88892 [Colletotrichum phormii]|uniref:Uncharacterized protein n=1 Tax=Colletotrichum phormii TaxID=359342 RepID=A0AAJ0A2L5_9PEZI|nr:uncharacterized protein BDP81DRAFT_88892 [Colletotrichum phormii]KAK1654803.1 hypothetical protein BDP81DRAFT_88892 [Colletotrichum phormii]
MYHPLPTTTCPRLFSAILGSPVVLQPEREPTQKDSAELRSRQAIVIATLGIPGRFWAFHLYSPRQFPSLPYRLWTTTLIQPFAITRAWHKLLLAHCSSSPALGIVSLSSCSLVPAQGCSSRCALARPSHARTSPGRIYRGDPASLPVGLYVLLPPLSFSTAPTFTH